MKLRQTVWIAALANLAYFGIEFLVALSIGSVSLFADSVDFLEDASVNFLVLAGLNWSARNRARLGIVLSCSILLPAIATFWMALEKFQTPVAPGASPLAMTAAGALLVNLFCTMLLAKFRHQGGSLVRAAFLSARNDVIANIAIIIAAFATFSIQSFWPDLIVGIGIGIMNMDAARQVFQAARREIRQAG